MNIVILYTYLKIVKEEIGTNFGEDILRMYGNIDIEKAKEYQDIVEEYLSIEKLLFMELKILNRNLSKMVEKKFIKGLIKIDYIIYEKAI